MLSWLKCIIRENKKRKVTAGVGYYSIGECESQPCICCKGSRISLADLLPEGCVDFPTSEDFKFKITVEVEPLQERD